MSQRTEPRPVLPGIEPQPWTTDEVDPLLALAVHQNEVHAMVLTDAQGLIRWCNAACERMFGHRRSALVGHPLHILFNRHDIDRGVPEWEMEVTALRHRSEDDRWMQRADGSGLYVAGTLQALHDASGEVVGYAKVMRNRTDAYSHALALRNGRNAAVAAMASRDATLEPIAHRLHASLSAIGLAAAVLRQLATQGDLRAQSVIATLERQTANMALATNQLLDAVQPDPARRVARPQAVLLQDVLRAVVHGAEAGPRVELTVLDGPVSVMGDHERLRSAFTLLLDHALTPNPPGTRINVRLNYEGWDAVVRVEDHGRGLQPDQQDALFAVFTGGARTTGGDGAEIDRRLLDAHRIVVAHGGSLQVMSDGAGTGTTLTVRLPLLDADLIDAAGPMHGHDRTGGPDGA